MRTQITKTKLSTTLIGLLTTTLLASSCSSPQEESDVSIPGLVRVQVPSSTNQYPNSTWWGYNMSKIVRHGTNVYYGIIENDTGSSSQTANFKIYKKPDAGSPVLVASHPTSRPGNVVIDASGKLHLFVFEPVNASINDSVGSLAHYQYNAVESGDFTLSATNYLETAPNATTEVANIRIGATVGHDDRLAVSYGLNSLSGFTGRLVVLHTKDPAGSWARHVKENLVHEYYYPFLAATQTGTLIMPVQDDYVAGPSAFNRYYKIPLFKFDGSSWTDEMLLDLSSDPLAVNDQKPQLAEQTELFERSSGEVIAIYKDKRNNSNVKFLMRSVSTSGVVGSQVELSWANGRGINWIRAFEIDSDVYFFGVSWEDAYMVRASDSKTVKVKLPGLQSGSYVYLSSNRGGAFANSQTAIDIYAITGNSSNYPSPGANIYRIPKASIKNLF
jgi:hypothetical protein